MSENWRDKPELYWREHLRRSTATSSACSRLISRIATATTTTMASAATHGTPMIIRRGIRATTAWQYSIARELLGLLELARRQSPPRTRAPLLGPLTG